MGNAAFAYDNLADAAAATTVASAEVEQAPVSRLQDPHVARRWQANATSATLTTDLGSSIAFTETRPLTIGLFGVTITTAGLTRIRVSNTDPTGVLGEVYDSGSAAGRVDARYGYLIALVTGAVTARYVLTELSEAGVASIGAGRQFIGPRVIAGINFGWGWSRTAVRRSKNTEGVGGQTFVDRKKGYFAADMTFGWLTEAEKDGFVEDIEVATVNDGHIDMLWIKDVDSTNLGRDCIWGYIEGDAPVTQPVHADYFSKALRIRQRL